MYGHPCGNVQPATLAHSGDPAPVCLAAPLKNNPQRKTSSVSAPVVQLQSP